MIFYGILRVKNEARWIKRVIEAILPLCDRVFVLDDSSTDGTPEKCESVSECVSVTPSPFSGLDESRDRDYLLTKAFEYVPGIHTQGDPASPYWALAIDGDEVLEDSGPQIIRDALANYPHARAFSLRIPYLWDSEDQIRTDGVYAHFARPSLFRLMNRQYRYQTTTAGGNCHCSSIPQEMLGSYLPCQARLWHYGYLHREDRIRKYQWYNQVDPNNQNEDGYRHMVVGDIFPAGAQFRWGGPLKLESIHANVHL